MESCKRFMNPNDILAQQQELLNQAMHNNQQVMWGVLAIQAALLILTGWVIYMFYARLRDIADELRKFRVAYEVVQERAIRGVPCPPIAASAENLFASDARYMPKK